MGVKGEETRARLIAGTRTLIEAQGYFGTGLNQIVAATGAPRGSLYFHFPEGKDQLVAVSLVQAGQEVEDLLAALAAEGADSGALTERLTEVFAERLAGSDYTKGCPIATVALEVAGTNEPLRAVCAEVYELAARAGRPAGGRGLPAGRGRDGGRAGTGADGGRGPARVGPAQPRAAGPRAARRPPPARRQAAARTA